MALRTISICAGVGALDLGVRIARPDARYVAFVEKEVSATASLVASWKWGGFIRLLSGLTSEPSTLERGAADCVLSGDP